MSDRKVTRAEIYASAAELLKEGAPQVGLLYGDDGEVFGTTDGGENWDRIAHVDPAPHMHPEGEDSLESAIYDPMAEHGVELGPDLQGHAWMHGVGEADPSKYKEIADETAEAWRPDDGTNVTEVAHVPTPLLPAHMSEDHGADLEDVLNQVRAGHTLAQVHEGLGHRGHRHADPVCEECGARVGAGDFPAHLGEHFPDAGAGYSEQDPGTAKGIVRTTEVGKAWEPDMEIDERIKAITDAERRRPKRGESPMIGIHHDTGLWQDSEGWTHIRHRRTDVVSLGPSGEVRLSDVANGKPSQAETLRQNLWTPGGIHVHNVQLHSEGSYGNSAVTTRLVVGHNGLHSHPYRSGMTLDPECSQGDEPEVYECGGIHPGSREPRCTHAFWSLHDLSEHRKYAENPLAQGTESMP